MAGFFLAWIPILWLFLDWKILDDFWYQTLILNVFNYAPLPIIDTARKLLWLLVIFLPVFWMVFKNYREHRNEKIVFFSMAVAPIPFLLARGYLHYWIQVMPFLVILFVSGKYSWNKFLIGWVAVWTIVWNLKDSISDYKKFGE